MFPDAVAGLACFVWQEESAIIQIKCSLGCIQHIQRASDQIIALVGVLRRINVGLLVAEDPKRPPSSARRDITCH